VERWNSWFTSMIYLNDNGMYPLQIFVRDILLFDAAAGMTEDANAIYLKELTKYALIIVAVVPILFVYPFVQRYFVKGVMLGSVKG
jgi:putative aldouronate transport system permease protein